MNASGANGGSAGRTAEALRAERATSGESPGGSPIPAVPAEPCTAAPLRVLPVDLSSASAALQTAARRGGCVVAGEVDPALLLDLLRILIPATVAPSDRDVETQVWLVAGSRDFRRAASRAAHAAGCADRLAALEMDAAGLLRETAIPAAVVLLALPSDPRDAARALRFWSRDGLRRRILIPVEACAATASAIRGWMQQRGASEHPSPIPTLRWFEAPGAPAAGRVPSELFHFARDVGRAEPPDPAMIAEVGARLRGHRRDRAAAADGARRGWPRRAPDHELPSALPATLPDGTPWPKISVITPSFNQGAYIEETLLSVANQRYPNVEHIVIDGGSTDATVDVLERWAPRLAHCVRERDRGQSHAINKGFARATGELMMWLNSDDRLAPGALAAAALALHRSKADMVAGICEIYRDDAMIERHLTCCPDGPLPLGDLLDIPRAWMGGQFFYQPEVIFTRDLWQRAGGRVDESWHYSMDYELWLRFAAAGATLCVIGRPIAQFRVHPQQKTTAAAEFRAELDRVVARFRADHADAPHVTPVADGDVGRDRMRITFFNDIGYMAGAGVAHQRLARACAAAGHEVSVVAVSDGSTLDRDPPVSIQSACERIAAQRPDVVVVGNLHSAALGPELLGAISSRWPTTMVLHDQWALTGRCAYTGGCEKYRGGCDHTCPTPEEYPALAPERIAAAHRHKRLLYTQGHAAPRLLANSEWMRRFAADALGPGADGRLLHTLRLSAPTDLFRPRDRAACRERFDLPADRFIIMTSGTSADDPRKGLSHLAEALQLLDLPDVLVVSIGHADATRPPPMPGFRAMGYLRDPRDVAMLYSACDLFVGPSLAEAFGQVFIEAAACGIPSVGYPVGGIPEALIDGVSGRIAREVSPAALAEAIEELYADDALRSDLGAWARILAECEFSPEASYRSWFGALRAGGIAESLGLRRKIWLAPRVPEAPRVEFVSPEHPGWSAVDGFDHWEGPYPQDDLPRCRWAMGPVSRLSFEDAAGGERLLLIACRNYWAGQRLRVVVNGTCAGEHEVPVSGNERTLSLCTGIMARAGRNEVELHHWQWDATNPGRPIALLILEIHVTPR
ncbi:MAG: glycosyltransferase [Phycisphaerales bacterium]|nr:glycosyltransferase [Phycisphaerales bacterium]